MTLSAMDFDRDPRKGGGLVIREQRNKDGQLAGVGVYWVEQPRRSGGGYLTYALIIGPILLALLSAPLALVVFIIALPVLIFSRRLVLWMPRDVWRGLVIKPDGRLRVPYGLPGAPEVRELTARYGDVVEIRAASVSSLTNSPPSRNPDDSRPDAAVFLQLRDGTMTFVTLSTRPVVLLQPVVVALDDAWEAMRPVIQAQAAGEAVAPSAEPDIPEGLPKPGLNLPGGWSLPGGWWNLFRINLLGYGLFAAILVGLGSLVFGRSVEEGYFDAKGSQYYDIQRSPEILRKDPTGTTTRIINALTLYQILPYRLDGPRVTYKTTENIPVRLTPEVRSDNVIGTLRKGACIQALDKGGWFKPSKSGEQWEEFYMLDRRRLDRKGNGPAVRLFVPHRHLTMEAWPTLICMASAFVVDFGK
jgi:hypothetical protein